jgi:hypothetical protein
LIYQQTTSKIPGEYQHFTNMFKKKEEKAPKLKKITLQAPEDVIDGLKKSSKRHYRSFNGEAIFAWETYLTHFWKDANSPKQESK